MKIFTIFSTLILISITSVPADEIQWINNVDNALEQSKKENKIIMIDVFTDWCTWCVKLDNDTYTDKKVIALSKNFINLKVNPEKDMKANEFLKKFKIAGYPTILFVNQSSNLVNRIGGYLPPEDFSKKMEMTINISKNMTLYIEELDKGNYKNAKELFDYYIEVEKINDAVNVYDKIKNKKIFSADDTVDANIKLGLYYGQLNDISKAKDYFSYAYSNFKDSQRYFEVGYYYALSEYLIGNKEMANKIINEILANKKINDTWKNHFTELTKKINN